MFNRVVTSIAAVINPVLGVFIKKQPPQEDQSGDGQQPAILPKPNKPKNGQNLAPRKKNNKKTPKRKPTAQPSPPPAKEPEPVEEKAEVENADIPSDEPSITQHVAEISEDKSPSTPVDNDQNDLIRTESPNSAVMSEREVEQTESDDNSLESPVPMMIDEKTSPDETLMFAMVPLKRETTADKRHRFVSAINGQPTSYAYLRQTIGVVCAKPDYIFDETEEANYAGTLFLTQFFSEDHKIKLIMNAALEKNHKLISPCLSFVVVKPTNRIQRTCYLALSGSDDNAFSDRLTKRKQLKEAIMETCRKLNEDKTIQEKKLYFDLISERSDNFKDMLSLAVTKKKSLISKGNNFVVEKVCTEHHIAATLSKLFHKYPNQVKVMGMTSIIFSPISTLFHDEKLSDFLKISANKAHYYQKKISCCENCRTAKNLFVEIMKAANTVGEERQKPTSITLPNPQSHSLFPPTVSPNPVFSPIQTELDKAGVQIDLPTPGPIHKQRSGNR